MTTLGHSKSTAVAFVYLDDRLLPAESTLQCGCLRKSTSFDRHRFRSFENSERDNLLLMSGMQSLNVAHDAPIAFAAAPLQRVPVDNLHVAAAANDRPIFLQVSGMAPKNGYENWRSHV